MESGKDIDVGVEKETPFRADGGMKSRWSGAVSEKSGDPQTAAVLVARSVTAALG